MINRAAVILVYKKPAVNWVNESDPSGKNPEMTIESINEDYTVYLIRPEDADTPDALNQWIKLNYKTLFENELESWYMDDGLWPQKRTLKMFREWFKVECHSVIEDTVGDPIEDDEG